MKRRTIKPLGQDRKRVRREMKERRSAVEVQTIALRDQQPLRIDMRPPAIVVRLEQRNGVDCLTLRCEHGGLIVLPDSVNQVALLVSS